jgi:hypothetical protein
MDATLTVTGQEIIIKSPYDAAFINAIKAIPGRRWDKIEKAWIVPVEAEEEVQALVQEYFADNEEEEQEERFVTDLLTYQEARKAQYQWYKARGISEIPDAERSRLLAQYVRPLALAYGEETIKVDDLLERLLPDASEISVFIAHQQVREVLEGICKEGVINGRHLEQYDMHSPRFFWIEED